MIKNYLLSYLYLFSIIIVSSIILSIINYLTTSPLTIIKVLIPIISLLISSIILGKKTKSKAYLEGIKFSTLFLLIITILKFILKTAWSYKTIILYLIFILTSVIGSTIGINLKKDIK